MSNTPGGGGRKNVDFINRFYRPGLKRYSGHSLKSPLCYLIYACADDFTVSVDALKEVISLTNFNAQFFIH